MRRLIGLIVLLPGLFQQAYAQQSPGSETIPAYLTQRFGVAKQKAVEISAAVTRAAEKYSLPPAVLLAIISIESRFRETAHGTHGATGLMQVVPAAHRDIVHNTKDLTRPEINIDIGSSILYGYLRNAGGDLDAAMKKYGGSLAYAHMIDARAAEFAPLFSAPQTADAASSGIVTAVLAAPQRAADPATAQASAPQAVTGGASISNVSESIPARGK